MNEMNTTNNSSHIPWYKDKWIWYGAGSLIVVVLVLLIVFLPKNNMKEDSEQTINENEQNSLVMQPIVDNNYTYQFEEIEWNFDSFQETTGEERTKVSFTFKNFSRNSGSFVTFGNPYKLGTYSGACNSVDSLSYDAEVHKGIPLAYAECQSAGGGQQFVIFQEGENIVAKSRPVYKEVEGDVPTEFFNIYTVNVTEVVQ